MSPKLKGGKMEIKSLEIGLRILEYVNSKKRPVTIHEISERIGIKYNSACYYMYTLDALGTITKITKGCYLKKKGKLTITKKKEGGNV